MVKKTDSLDPSKQCAPPPSPPSIAVLSIELRLKNAPVLPAELPEGVRAWAPTLERYFLADAEPHLPVLPSLTALTHLSLHAPSPASIPALLHAATPSLTAPTLHFPPAALPALGETLAGLRVASDATPDSPLHAENQDGASKGTIPALLAPNLRALAVPAASAASTAARGAGARVDVGKGKQKGGQRGRRRRSGASAGPGGGAGAEERCVLLPPLFISLLFASLRLHDAIPPGVRTSLAEPNSVPTPLHPTPMRPAAPRIPLEHASCALAYHASVDLLRTCVGGWITAPPSGRISPTEVRVARRDGRKLGLLQHKLSQFRICRKRENQGRNRAVDQIRRARPKSKLLKTRACRLGVGVKDIRHLNQAGIKSEDLIQGGARLEKQSSGGSPSGKTSFANEVRLPLKSG
ncbi:hypothetical protein B0H11DRAFT_2192980 [Mycena galericulata]|nr:hypothetical protein B0H11DRAFT_2192980 [Mycena galericulata]